MERRKLVLAMAVVCAAPFALPALAQSSAKIEHQVRIAYLTGYSDRIDAPLFSAFKQGLSELGYVDGRNIVIDRRFAGGQPERLPVLASELMQRKPDIF